MEVICILGTGHCGSTLLDMLLGSHPQISGVGEIDTILKQLDRGTQCTCGKRIEECAVWSKKVEAIKGWEGIQAYRNKFNTIFDKNTFEYLDTEHKVNQENFCKNQHELYEFILGDQDTKVVIDSSKNPDRVALMDRCEHIEPVIVHLVRDGRGVLWSYKKKYDRTLAFIWKWVAENLKIELIKRRCDCESVFTSYSNLCNDPKGELKKILKKVKGVDFEEGMLDFRSSEHHQVGGNRMRLRDSSEIKEDLSWQDELSPLDRVLFWLTSGWLYWYYFFK